MILAAIEQWGLNQSLQKLNGMFAFALWDRKSRSLHLVRDRLGKKPLYVGWSGKGKSASLVFGSELKALRAHPDFNAGINRETLAQYMRYGNTMAPHCIYDEVWQLPAGMRLDLDLTSLTPGENLAPKMKPYWDHQRIAQDSCAHLNQGTESQIIDEFETLLEDAVRSRMISDVPLGAFLSGGIDSSAIVALMQKTSSQPVKTYTIGFEEKAFNEAEHAKNIAAHLGTDHHELYLTGQDALNQIPRLPTMYDEPFADSSAIPTFLVSQFARQDVTVALSGDGGDEMLGGYNRYRLGPKIWNAMRLIPQPLRSLMAKSMHSVPQSKWDKSASWAAPKSRPHFGRSMHKLADLLPAQNGAQIYDHLLTQCSRSPLLNPPDRPPLVHDDYANIAGLPLTEQMMLWDALLYLPNDILTKVDRAAMAVSLEVRAPLLDYRIFEYCWSLPSKYKLRGNAGKYLLRETLARHIPRDMFERPKQGFSVPVGDWLRGPLKDWAGDLLSPDAIKSQGLLDPDHVNALWNAHAAAPGTKQAADHPNELWTILMFQAWHAEWM